MEEQIEGTGVLTSEMSQESWTVTYKGTFNTDMIIVSGRPVARTRGNITIDHDANTVFRDGKYSLQTDEEFIALEQMNGEWFIVSRE